LSPASHFLLGFENSSAQYAELPPTDFGRGGVTGSQSLPFQEAGRAGGRILTRLATAAELTRTCQRDADAFYREVLRHGTVWGNPR
jgi:hypothetical protein